jgi:peptide/nickel transport system ATP-binding protein
MSLPVLSLRISVDYREKACAIDDVAFEIGEGEVFGLAGESGSGKSTIALAILRLLDMRGGRADGEICFEGYDLMRYSEREMRRVRGREISLVMQSPTSAFNPVLRIETHLREAWCVHSSTPWRDARADATWLLRRLGLPDDDAFLRRYPGQLSVGQAQRVLVAMAVLHRPKLVVADEPTSALDPASRGECLDLLRQINREFGSAILFISHDLASMNELCHRIAVLRDGKLVECREVKGHLGWEEPSGFWADGGRDRPPRVGNPPHKCGR